jgi:hypothetical protein
MVMETNADWNRFLIGNHLTYEELITIPDRCECCSISLDDRCKEHFTLLLNKLIELNFSLEKYKKLELKVGDQSNQINKLNRKVNCLQMKRGSILTRIFKYFKI